MHDFTSIEDKRGTQVWECNICGSFLSERENCKEHAKMHQKTRNRKKRISKRIAKKKKKNRKLELRKRREIRGWELDETERCYLNSKRIVCIKSRAVLVGFSKGNNIEMVEVRCWVQRSGTLLQVSA